MDFDFDENPIIYIFIYIRISRENRVLMSMAVGAHVLLLSLDLRAVFHLSFPVRVLH